MILSQNEPNKVSHTSVKVNYKVRVINTLNRASGVLDSPVRIVELKLGVSGVRTICQDATENILR